METFSLADHRDLATTSSLSREETFRTRLVQIDRPTRHSVRDPLQHWLRKLFRRLWYYSTSDTTDDSVRATSVLPVSNASSNNGNHDNRSDGRDVCKPDAMLRSRWRRSYQNTAWFADTISRFLFGLLAGGLLITPMVVLGQESRRSAQLAIVSIFIAVFSFIVALVSRASPQETMAASAAYAAVLVVFISTNSIKSDTS